MGKPHVASSSATKPACCWKKGRRPPSSALLPASRRRTIVGGRIPRGCFSQLALRSLHQHREENCDHSRLNFLLMVVVVVGAQQASFRSELARTSLSLARASLVDTDFFHKVRLPKTRKRKESGGVGKGRKGGWFQATATHSLFLLFVFFKTTVRVSARVKRPGSRKPLVFAKRVCDRKKLRVADSIACTGGGSMARQARQHPMRDFSLARVQSVHASFFLPSPPPKLACVRASRVIEEITRLYCAFVLFGFVFCCCFATPRRIARRQTDRQPAVLLARRVSAQVFKKASSSSSFTAT